MGKETKPQFSMKKVKQYLLVGRAKPSEKEHEPKVYRMRVFAPNTVVAKSRFWTLMRKQKKIKHSGGELITIQEVPPILLSPRCTKLRTSVSGSTEWSSGTSLARATTTCTGSSATPAFAAPSARCVLLHASFIDMDMAGRHRARAETIHVIRTAVIPQDKLRRQETKTYSV